MTRRYAYAPGGTRAVGYAPRNWHATTMIGAMTAAGPLAGMVIDGATDRAVFTAFIRAVLVPQLKPGDLVIMDNLSAHKHPQIEQLLKDAGAAALFLPPYSPDLNPIEKMWSKIKTLLRQYQARSKKTLLTAIAKAWKTVTAKDAAAWCRSCGYLLQKRN